MTYKEPEQNFTKIPNPILDVMGEMSESELKLTMCLVRYTFGYHTDRAQMTYEIMQDRTGMSRGGVYRAIELVEERGFFRRGRKSYWHVNSSQFEPCYVNKEVVNSSESELKYVGNSSESEPTKRKEIKENNKTRADESLIAFFEGMTAFTPPYETTDAYAEEWLLPVQAILSQSVNYSEAENRLTWAIQEMRRKRYTIKSPKSCLTMALNWHDGPAPSPNGNGRSQPTNGKTEAMENIRKAVTTYGAQRYKQAMSILQEPEQAIVKKMAPTWRDVCMMDANTFQVRYYQALKGA